ncbi:hypothetical protein SAMD00019534_058070, partial [Acytostelium subglobosum LB1]|uniref:hypothetical protein n=1 Tax=Acytostelium subglobosum LB1 TaxID=1410327 RepID=UPI0006452086
MNTYTLIAVVIIVYLILDFIYKIRRLTKDDAPGPMPLPLIGNLHQVGPSPHIGMAKLTEKFGHVMRIWLGDNYHIIVSDPAIVREMVVRNQDNFTNRIQSPSLEIMSKGYLNMVVGRDEHWSHIRKLVSNSFTKTKLRSFSSAIEEQGDHLITKLRQFEKDNQSPRDIMDSLIIDAKGELKDSVIMVGVDFIIAGTETSASTIEMFMMYMINHPDIQAKVASELASAVGPGNRVTFSHRPHVPYTVAVINEVMRIRPVVALAPRECKEACMLGGKYYVPAGTQLFVNQKAMNFHPDHWDQPEKFNPERFLLNDKYKDVFLPFSAGPRNCVGMNLAIEEVFVGCANILHNFILSSSNNQPIHEEEVFGLTIMPIPFQVCVNSRY